MDDPNNETVPERVVDILDRHFPKGEVKERGRAILLVAEILIAYDLTEKVGQ